jgi:hypothetical protein
MAPKGTRDKEPTKELPGDLTAVRFTTGGDAALVGADMDDPGIMDWWGSASITEYPSLEDDDEQLDPEQLKQEGYALSVRDVGGGGLQMSILEAHGLIVDLWRVQNIYDALDARSGDYAKFIPMFGERGEHGQLELADELEDSLNVGGTQVLILDRVGLAPAWRGCGGVGRLLTIRLLRWVCDDPRVIALTPFPVELDDEQRNDKQAFRKGMARVRRTWKSIGFEPFSDDIWALDPRTKRYDQTDKQLSKRLGIPR